MEIDINGVVTTATRENDRSTDRSVDRTDNSTRIENQVSDKKSDTAAVEAALEGNKKIEFGGRSVEFAFNRDVNRVVITVRSDETEEIVRQIPGEDYLKFVGRFNELLGVLFDEEA